MLILRLMLFVVSIDTETILIHTRSLHAEGKRERGGKQREGGGIKRQRGKGGKSSGAGRETHT